MSTTRSQSSLPGGAGNTGPGGAATAPDTTNGLPATSIGGDRNAGMSYSIQMRAIGGSTGYSNGSEPVSHMSM